MGNCRTSRIEGANYVCHGRQFWCHFRGFGADLYCRVTRCVHVTDLDRNLDCLHGTCCGCFRFCHRVACREICCVRGCVRGLNRRCCGRGFCYHDFDLRGLDLFDGFVSLLLEHRGILR